MLALGSFTIALVSLCYKICQLVL
ncbi:hypothetical protein [Streptococcus suis]